MNIKKWPFTKNYYIKLLLSFILMSVIIVISASAVFSKIYMDSIYDQLKVQYINDLDRVNNNVDNIVKQMEQVNIYLRQNADIYSFLTSAEYDSQTANRAYNSLMLIKQTDSYIRSVYLYNKNINFFLHTGLSDIDINEILSENSGIIASNSPFRMVFSTISFNPLSGAKPVATISFVFGNRHETSGTPDNAVIINLDRQAIEKDILSKSAGVSIITDAQGKIIFDPMNYEPIGSSSLNLYFENVLLEGGVKGSIVYKEESGNKIITYVKSLETGCYLINIVPYKDISGVLYSKRNAIILISLCALFLFGLIGFLIANKIYSPVEKMTEMFSRSNLGNLNEDMSEFAVITRVFQDTLQRYKSMEEKSFNKNFLLKDNFLRDLLKSKHIINDYKSALEEYSIELDFSNVVPITIKIDNYTQNNPSVRAACESTLCRIIPDILKEDFRCETVNMYDGEIALLLNFRVLNEDNFNLLLTNMDKLRDTSRKTLQVTLSIGIGETAGRIEDCLREYAAALELLKYRFTLGFDRCFYKKYLEDNLSANISFPAETEHNLALSLKLGKREQFLDEIRRLTDILKTYPYSDAMYIFYQIALTCMKIINQTIHQDDCKFSVKFTNIFTELETLEQSSDWLINAFDEYQRIISDINRLKNSKHYKLIEDIQEYIGAHYQEINLSVESIAEITGYTPYYFSKIFKDVTGLNINDYICQFRIDKAKELLITSNRKVNEIPELLGFTSASHFFSSFKKYVGLTPAAYREYIFKNKQDH